MESSVSKSDSQRHKMDTPISTSNKTAHRCKCQTNATTLHGHRHPKNDLWSRGIVHATDQAHWSSKERRISRSPQRTAENTLSSNTSNKWCPKNHPNRPTRRTRRYPPNRANATESLSQGHHKNMHATTNTPATPNY